MKNNKLKYKTYKQSKIKALLTSAKKLFKNNNRGFTMLKKGSNEKQPVINSKIHRSIK